MTKYRELAVLLTVAWAACSSENLGVSGGNMPGGGINTVPGSVSGTAGTVGTTPAAPGTAGAAPVGTPNAMTPPTTPAMTPSGTGAAGTVGGMSMTPAAGECLNRGETNFDCPFNLPPIMGSCAPADVCCHRSSNVAKIATLAPDAPAQIEYRLNYVDIYNHPQSIGLPDIMRTAGQRADVCSGEQCLLWRFTAPRAGGQYVAGKGEVEIGVGAYNCDGTYSFYGPSAAPDRTAIVGESDPGRWQSVKVPADVDPTKTNVDRFRIPWATNRNREISRSIFLVPADNTIDWELASSGFTITSIEWTDQAVDCIGSRNGFIGWNTVAGFESYSPIVGNEKDVSDQINQTYCALLGFGLLPEGMKNKDCQNTPRCVPDGGSYADGGCDWVKLPDSLCPTTEAERALYGCHLGAEGNINKEEGYPTALNCTPTAPTTPQNPDMGVATTGQCCDPMAASTTLPACNAYRTLGKFVAAAAEITDAPRNSLPPQCN